jgi:hypothetical protein
METRHSNDRLSLYGIGDTPAFVAKRRHAILTRCLPFVTKVAASEILNKLRRAKKQSVSFYALPSQVRASVMWMHLIFFRLEMITFEYISDPCLLFKFFYIVVLDFIPVDLSRFCFLHMMMTGGSTFFISLRGATREIASGLGLSKHK